MFSGSMVAIVTPFSEGKIDRDALAELVEFQLAGGTHAIVPCGTTGESATLSFEEHKEVVKLVVEVVAGRVPVLAGTGSNCTREAQELTISAREAGADGALVISPYYNKPSQEGLYQHYAYLARETAFPIVMYNVPGRTSLNMEPKTVARLAEIDNIVGIKEASGSLKQITEIITLTGDDFRVYSGDDFIVLPIMSVGGDGVISVVANIIPNEMAQLVLDFQANEYENARKLQLKVFPLCQAMFCDTNPVPVKTALSLMGKIKGDLRLPLAGLSPEKREDLKKTLTGYGLLTEG
ncbi:MAG: 4-hydroxy-tetrahydrodipicolinate synthase [bacterium]